MCAMQGANLLFGVSYLAHVPGVNSHNKERVPTNSKLILFSCLLACFASDDIASRRIAASRHRGIASRHVMLCHPWKSPHQTPPSPAHETKHQRTVFTTTLTRAHPSPSISSPLFPIRSSAITTPSPTSIIVKHHQFPIPNDSKKSQVYIYIYIPSHFFVVLSLFRII